MAGHFDKSFTTRDPEMARYLAAVPGAAKHFLGITYKPSQEETMKRLTNLPNWTAPHNAPRRTSSKRYYARLRPRQKHMGQRAGRTPSFSSTKLTGEAPSPNT